MWVNNEIGTIQPIAELAQFAKSVGALFHTDAVQAFGKIADRRARRFRSTSSSISGHKIGAPKGIGAMFIRRGIGIEPLFHGGTQDRGRRAGNGERRRRSIGFARAAELAVAEREEEWHASRAAARSTRGGDPRAHSRRGDSRSRRAAARAAHRQRLGARHRQRVDAHGARPARHRLLGGIGVSEREHHAVARAERDRRLSRTSRRRRFA